MSEFVRDEAHASTAARETASPRAARPRGPEPVMERRTSARDETHARVPSGLSVRGQATPAAGRGGGAGRGADRDGAEDQLFGEIIGGLLGAGAGAAIGGLIGGGVGAIIGGVLGAVAGGIIGHLVSRRTVTINVTRLAGVADTTGIDVARANAIYRQASVHVTTGRTEALPASVSNAILGADGALDNFSGSTLTTEETRLVGHNRTPGRITAYYVPKFRDPGLRGEAIRPSRFGVPAPSVVVGAQTRVLDTLAHELGHALTNDGSHSSDASNLMARGAIRNFTDTLTPAQISAIQSSPYVR
jgi:hypothetical protein